MSKFSKIMSKFSQIHFWNHKSRAENSLDGFCENGDPFLSEMWTRLRWASCNPGRLMTRMLEMKIQSCWKAKMPTYLLECLVSDVEVAVPPVLQQSNMPIPYMLHFSEIVLPNLIYFSNGHFSTFQIVWQSAHIQGKIWENRFCTGKMDHHRGAKCTQI